MESLGRLMNQSENDAMMANLLHRMNGIQCTSTVARFHEFEEESDRAIDGAKEKLEKLMDPLVSDWIKSEKILKQ